MNNYEEIIERIHASNMHKRESELNAIPFETRPHWPKIVLAASIACLICLSTVIITNNQPQPLEIAEGNTPKQFQSTDQLAIKTSEPQSMTSVPSALKEDKLTVVCLNDCDEKEVLQRFEQTLSSLN